MTWTYDIWIFEVCKKPCFGKEVRYYITRAVFNWDLKHFSKRWVSTRPGYTTRDCPWWMPITSWSLEACHQFASLLLPFRVSLTNSQLVKGSSTVTDTVARLHYCNWISFPLRHQLRYQTQSVLSQSWAYTHQLQTNKMRSTFSPLFHPEAQISMNRRWMKGFRVGGEGGVESLTCQGSGCQKCAGQRKLAGRGDRKLTGDKMWKWWWHKW